VRLLTGTISGSARSVKLITLGPLTDIALALQADPGIAHNIAMIYAMAGAVRVNGNEPKYANAEWNVYIDAAASRVLRSGIPMTFVPLDASDNVPITTFFPQTVQAHPRTPALRIVGTMLRDPYYTQSPTYFWDPLTAVAATDQQAVQLQAARLVISTRARSGPGNHQDQPGRVPGPLGHVRERARLRAPVPRDSQRRPAGTHPRPSRRPGNWPSAMTATTTPTAARTPPAPARCRSGWPTAAPRPLTASP
jgi:hypothetical protein